MHKGDFDGLKSRLGWERALLVASLAGIMIGISPSTAAKPLVASGRGLAVGGLLLLGCEPFGACKASIAITHTIQSC